MGQEAKIDPMQEFWKFLFRQAPTIVLSFIFLGLVVLYFKDQNDITRAQIAKMEAKIVDIQAALDTCNRSRAELGMKVAALELELTLYKQKRIKQ